MLDLSALDGIDAGETIAVATTAMAERKIEGEVIESISVKRLQPGKYQPRRDFSPEELKELSDSIREMGVLQPLIACPVEDDKLEIVAGERRWRAAMLAELDKVPVLVRKLSEKQRIAIALIENIHRADLSPMEKAIALQRMKDEFGLKNKEVADAVQISQSEVTRLLGLLKLPEPIKRFYDSGVKSLDAITELSIAYKENPEKTEMFLLSADASITSKEARAFKDSLKEPVTEVVDSKEQSENKQDTFSKAKDNEKSKNEDQGEQGSGKDVKPKNNIDNGELTSWPKGKAIADPDRLKKPLLLVEYEGRSAAILLNRKPSETGFIVIRFEDGGGDKEVNASDCKINMLMEE